MIDTGTENLVALFLAQRDEHCPVCQYNLRGCSSPTCPECGTQLALALRAGSAPRHCDGWWLGGVIGLALSLLITAVLFFPLLSNMSALLVQPMRVQLVAQGVAPSSSLPNWWLLVRMATLLSILAISLGWLAMSRLHLRCAGRWRRVTIGIATSAAPLLLLLVLRILTSL